MSASRAALLAVVAALVLGGCGDDDDSSGSDGALSKEAYIEAGDRLCDRFLTESLVGPASETPEGLADYLEKLLGVADDIDAEFRGLDPPEDAAGVHTELLDAFSASTAKVREAVAALRKDDPSWEALLDEAQQLGQASDDPAKAYGFKICGSEEQLSEERSTGEN